MATLNAVVLALLSILSVVAATEHPAVDNNEGTKTSRSLLAGKCSTRPYAQCGGQGLGGRSAGVWRCCPAGFYCKKYNYWWWSCQKRGGKKAPAPKPKPGGPKVSVSKNPNKRVRDGGAYNPNGWDPCANILPNMKANSHWCKYPKVKKNPSRYGLKVDRQTSYNGPILQQVGYCGKAVSGSYGTAGLAISTKYLAKDGWKFGYDPYCGKCACIRITGNDYWVNPTPNPPEWKNYIGTVVKGTVVDMCPECCDDHIDILQDRGYTYAPTVWNNPKASEANSLPGIRPMPLNIVNSVGVWTIEWDWLDDCSQTCDQNFFKP